MKSVITVLSLSLLLGLSHTTSAQATTGGRSGGSSASTGAGYESEGKRPSTSNAASMTIADEGASRAYMYVPPTPAKNRSASPDGSNASPTRRQPSTTPGSKSIKKAGKSSR